MDCNLTAAEVSGFRGCSLRTTLFRLVLLFLLCWSFRAEATESEITLRLGNESNPVDGFLGPMTYGARASHTFDFAAIEAGYVRLHEPATPTFESEVDEAQISLRSPELHVIELPIIIGLTGWKNRMIDMYTNLLGLEVTSTGPFSLSLGIYVGSATLDELKRNFVGGQVGLSHTFKKVELGLSYMAGAIAEGSYRKVSAEASSKVFESNKTSVQITFGVEDRYYNFGNGLPVSEPADEFIFVSGLEFRVEHLLGL